MATYDSNVTLQLPTRIEERLASLTREQGRSIDDLVEEAIEGYLLVAALTDVTPGDVAATQQALLSELADTPPWSDP